MALNKTYGFSDIRLRKGPAVQVDRDPRRKAYVALSHTEEGFSRMEDIRGFEVCGPDRVFHPADVAVDRRKLLLVISSKEVVRPVAVRYGFRDFMPGNLANIRGLPVVPFRTDDF